MNSELAVAKATAKLTPKQRRFWKIYAETLNATEAAMQAYDCKDRDSAKAIGGDLLSKLNFLGLMDAMGLDDEHLLKVGQEGLNKSARFANINGKTQAVPDYATRHKYWDTFLKLRGKLSDKLELTGEDGGPIQMQVLAGVSFIPPKDD